ncbi:hypothetical protein HDV57DRAFT_492804 [Trichoderma longibrachiatum]
MGCGAAWFPIFSIFFAVIQVRTKRKGGRKNGTIRHTRRGWRYVPAGVGGCGWGGFERREGGKVNRSTRPNHGV